MAEERKSDPEPLERREMIIEAGTNMLGRVIAIGPRGAETSFEAIAGDGTKLGTFPTKYMATSELRAHFIVFEKTKTWKFE